MKMMVVHENGNNETISLTGTCEVIEGTRLNRLRQASGAEFYFTPDGYYDGWGNAPSSSRQEMNSTDSSSGGTDETQPT